MFPYPRVKRAFDFITAAAILPLASPLMLVIAVAIRINMGCPVLFRQERPGFQGRLFTCLKFRTMAELYDCHGNLLEDEFRTSALGSFLRRTSLDELPQLWSILRGDLSFVGPRPLLTEYLPYYTPEERRRHSVRPGLTGWAQIHGRNHLAFSERLALDMWYVDHISWSLDASILLKTCWIVVTQRGYARDTTSLTAEREKVASVASSGEIPPGE
jgi:lipopolysaccharide/colanic/teichoic acid biosynthesis glycosyltransferase